jgi:ThiF family
MSSHAARDREAYFARVAPLLGQGLSCVTVAGRDLQLTAHALELLIACRLQQIAAPRSAATRSLQRFMAWKNPFSPVSWLHQPPGDVDLRIDARAIEPGAPPHLRWDAAARRVTLNLTPDDLWTQQALSYHAARQARDALMARGPWPDGAVYHGREAWPFWRGTQPPLDPPRARTTRRSPSLADKHVLLIGCGSVGSEAARLLAAAGVTRWTLVDGGEVSVFNPCRQWYGADEIGQPKVAALARRLPGRAEAIPRALGPDDTKALERLVEERRPDVTLLCAGTADHDPLARALWRLGLPHVVACAYPQARFFEVDVVLPSPGPSQVSTPCLHCFRGHLFRGAEPAPPMDDELASFLYQQLDPEERRRLYVDLVAEPATAIETGRVAEITARCAAEVLAPTEARSFWFQRMLAESTTCLLGGNVVEHLGDETSDETSYGLTYPGQVVRLGLGDVAGVEALRVCEVCGRELEVSHRLALPEAPNAPDESIDRALLG